LVFDAFCAAADRSAGERAADAARAWRAKERGDAASLPSRFNAFNDARDLLDEILCRGAP
jgi:hypothetical protein